MFGTCKLPDSETVLLNITVTVAVVVSGGVTLELMEADVLAVEIGSVVATVGLAGVVATVGLAGVVATVVVGTVLLQYDL